ncbi:MAG: lytic transglycosylase domain-containing protein [Bacteroidota bacterium]|jgi:hypothetical protein|nr:lytic transglycosylase domain-containing protein [Prolixibacteraceae bacterium]MDI9564298.1 lytic transglycosylase domain-containing protein [Bacteroidota bacterium]NLS99222.1 lytic transglycosylase domain-containing protein [Bacteroidales bacterium]HNZ68020.1 lytic transglycosylase domain-containing protein [Prolixibacteraceae bacterium]HOC86002.1 lytic transglycosylase domain-containing protein [Prolixibacteraceae bacterium]
MKRRIYGAAWVALVSVVVLFSTCGLNIKGNEESPVSVNDQASWYFTAPPVPDSVFFMGQRIPLERFDVYENLERELLVNANFHSQTIRLIKLAPRYFALIDPILEAEGVPVDFRYLCVAESTLNPRALSPAGAAGLWQFLKGAAMEYGLEVNAEVDERYHIEKSTRAACRYLKDSYAKYRDWAVVAASYNAGTAAVDRQIRRQKETSYFDLLFSEETERYVYRILSLKIILEDPQKYGFLIKEAEKYPVLKTRLVEIATPLADLADFAKSYGITYKTLKYYNPWLRETFLTNKTGKRYLIEIPA